MPLKIEGTALSNGSWRGVSGTYINYPSEVIKKSAPLLQGIQIRINHSEDDPKKVCGFVTKSWYAKNSKGKDTIKFKGVVYDYDSAKKIYDRKIKAVSVSPWLEERTDEDGAMICNDIRNFEEISILSGVSGACKDANVKAVEA